MPLSGQRAFTVLSPLETREAAERLAAAVASPGMGRAYHDLRPFVGHFDGRSFDMMMSSRGRNSFRPRITGVIEPAGRGTRISGTAQLHRGVLIFLLLFLSMPASFSASTVAASLESGRWDAATLIVPAVLVLFIAAVVLAFSWENRRAVRALTTLMEGDSTIRGA